MTVKKLAIVALGGALALAAAGCGSSQNSAGSGGSGSAAANSPASGCHPAHKFTTVNKGVLTVSSRKAFPPFTITNGNSVSGVDGDIVKQIAKMECLGIKVFTVETSAGHVEAVNTGRADLAMGDIYRTQARAKVVALSSPLYLDQMAIASRSGIDTVAQLKGIPSGTVQGYLWTDDLQALLGGSLKLYPNSLNMQEDLASGRLKAGVDSVGALDYAVKTGKLNGWKVNVAKPTAAVAATEQPGQAAFLMKKGNTALINAIDADIATLHKSGEIAKILKANGLPESSAVTGAAREVGK